MIFGIMAGIMDTRDLMESSYFHELTVELFINHCVSASGSDINPEKYYKIKLSKREPKEPLDQHV